jgi:hypothetical protein
MLLDRLWGAAASRPGDLARYLLWLGVLVSADANRRHFGLPSTWVFHTAGNTFTLLLPDLLRGLDRLSRPATARAGGRDRPIAAALRDLVVDNPQYVAYVAPLAIGYILSHPRCNIYRGDWGALRVAGFGLDSIPHSTTAAALTAIVMDGLDALARRLPAASPLAGPVGRARARSGLVAGLTLALATAGYETSEWLIHKAELRATGGDASRINMEWSIEDSLIDAVSNTIGWLAVVAYRSLAPVRDQRGLAFVGAWRRHARSPGRS